MNDLRADLTDCTSRLFYILKALDKQAEELHQKADRAKEFNRMLVYNIQEGRITDIEEIDTAWAWFDHSSLTPAECIERAKG